MEDQSKITVHDLLPLRSAELSMAQNEAADAARVPTRVLIVPWGRVESSSGEFVVDEESGRLAIEAFVQHGTDLPIDYEHQTLGGEFASPSGQAPAAGWIKQLAADAAVGIYADVEWTAPALEQLVARQYRYLSPVAIVRRADRKLIGLHSAALTNKPAIVSMPAIVNRHAGASMPSLDAETLRMLSEDSVIGPQTFAGAAGQAHSAADCNASGVPPTRGDAACAESADALCALRQRLGLDAASGIDVVLTAAERRLAEIDEQAGLCRAAEQITAALRAGKLCAHQRAWAQALALKDPIAFEQWLATAPVLVPLGRTLPPSETIRSAPRTPRAAAARAEYRAHPELATITSEEAFVADALRQS